jgi:general stress protein 26
MEWSEVVDEARRISSQAYLATIDRAGVPHIAFVAPGFGDQAIWVASDAGTAKVRHIQANPGVALHWPVDATTTNRQLLVTGVAAMCHDPAIRVRAWEGGFFPWDLGSWYRGPDDIDLAIIEISPRKAIVDHAHGPAIGRWRADTSER